MSNVYNSLKEYAVQVQDYYLSMFHAFLYTMKIDILDFVQNVPEFLKGKYRLLSFLLFIHK